MRLAPTLLAACALGCSPRNPPAAGGAPTASSSTSASAAPSTSTSASVAPSASQAWPKDPAQVAKGKELFAKTCTPCHGANGGGLVGPNLTDGAWLHGKGPERVRVAIRDGFPDKGMPTWRTMLSPEQIEALVAFVGSIVDTHVPDGKAPQGTP
ncbi:MAG: c-type cytochrome [Verrucomicrobia bacterium]|nr:c-type cytochrome [Verrucomicrobiota bacterium]